MIRAWAAFLLLLAAGVAVAGGFRSSPVDEARKASQDSLSQILRDAEQTEDLAGPSPGALFLRSLVVPGWGQAVLARSRPDLKGKGRKGFWLDMGLAAGVWGLSRYSEIKAAEYRSYAMQEAGAALHGSGSDYWVDVSNYISRDDFNQAMLESNLPDRRYLDQADDWNWGERDRLIRYRDLRAMSERAQSQALATCGVIFVNHVLSGVQALRLARTPGPVELHATTGAVLPGIGLEASFDLGRLLH